MNTKCAMMSTIFAGTSQGINHYTLISVDKIIENMQKYHKIQVKRRWVFYCLRYLEDQKMLRRKKRYYQTTNNNIRQKSSMITFSLKGVAYLSRNFVVGAKKIYKAMVRFSKEGDNRWPAKEIKKDTSYRPATIEERKWLNDLLGGIGRKI